MALQTANQYGLGIDGVGLSNRLLKIMQANKVDAATAQATKAEALQQQLKTTGAQLLHIRNNIEGKEAQKKAIANLATEKINQGQDSGIYDELLNIDDPDLLNTRMTQIIIRATDADKQLEKGLGLAQKGASTRAFNPITLVNPETKEKRLVTPTFDPNTNEATLSPFDIPDGFEISRETPEEKRAADQTAKVSTTEKVEDIKTEEIIGRERGKAKVEEETVGAIETKKTEAKGAATRQQKFIDDAVDSADAMANIQRSIELLGNVETGGFQNALLRAKQFFGIEGADEAELSNRLGKAVLSQLRETFGAAFTEGEGARLDRIEARFGKSTEGNKRLLEQIANLIERKAQRGIAAAEKAGDMQTAQDIRDALDFRFDSDEPARPGTVKWEDLQ